MHYLYAAGVQAVLQQVALVCKVRAIITLKDGSTIRQFENVLWGYNHDHPQHGVRKVSHGTRL
eukprot:11151237-Lingulodinium_polyedra.AAC.1